MVGDVVVGVTKQLQSVGRITLRAVAIIHDYVSTDITEYVRKSSCGIYVVERVSYG